MEIGGSDKCTRQADLCALASPHNGYNRSGEDQRTANNPLRSNQREPNVRTVDPDSEMTTKIRRPSCIRKTNSDRTKRKSGLFNLSNPITTMSPTTPPDHKEPVGCGRLIPIKEGLLYKKSNGLTNRDWKKKYVALLANGALMYYPSIEHYQTNSRAKKIDLRRVTVKVARKRSSSNKSPENRDGSISKSPRKAVKKRVIRDSLTRLSIPSSVLRFKTMDQPLDDGCTVIPNFVAGAKLNTTFTDDEYDGDSSVPTFQNDNSFISTASPQNQSNGSKRPKHNSQNQIFTIVSIDSKQWVFEARSDEDRDEWVNVIQNQILAILCANKSAKAKSQIESEFTKDDIIQIFRAVPGNCNCADCGAPDPTWASINLGILLCIQCSGLHRNLGTHISRVRSLELDDWPQELRRVMLSLGNTFANSVWESSLMDSDLKPSPFSPNAFKRDFIRAKYEKKKWMASIGQLDVGQELVEAVDADDTKKFYEVIVKCDDKLDHVLNRTLIRNKPDMLLLTLWAGAKLNNRSLIDSFESNASGDSIDLELCSRIVQQYKCVEDDEEQTSTEYPNEGEISSDTVSSGVV